MMEPEQRGHEQQQPRPGQQAQQPEDGLSGVVFQHARYLAAAKALLGRGQRSGAFE